MDAADLSLQLLPVWLLGLVAAVFGLVSAASRGRRSGAAGTAFLFALAALGSVLTWWRPADEGFLPLVVFAGLCGALGVARLPGLDLLCSRALAVLGNRRLQGVLLLTLCFVLPLWWADRVTPDNTFAEMEGEIGSWKLPPMQEVAAVAARTDRGRPVRLFAIEPGSVGDDELRNGEPTVLSGWTRELKVIRCGPPDVAANCHGWVFANGRYWIKGEDIERLLDDNGYRPVSAPQANDLVVYRDARRRIVHTGVVRALIDGGPVLVESKWGWLGRYIHPVEAQSYAQSSTYYRSDRPGHQLAGLSGETSPAALVKRTAEEPTDLDQRVFGE